MEHSESIKELAEALAIAQGKLKSVEKTGKGNYGSYAELAPTLDQVRPVLSEQGLSVTQMPIVLEDGTTGLVTMLMHKSGEWIKSTYPVRMQQQTPQAQGSAITYARRYSLMAVVGIAGDDDDGQAGTDGANPETRRTPKPAAKPASSKVQDSTEPEPATKPQKAQITAYLRSQGVEDAEILNVLRDDFNVQGELTRDEANGVLTEIKRLQVALQPPVDNPPTATKATPEPVTEPLEPISKFKQRILLNIAQKTAPGLLSDTEAIKMIEENAGKKIAELTHPEFDALFNQYKKEAEGGSSA